jgi:uncharacterized protein YeaO (DUF488 family)
MVFDKDGHLPRKDKGSDLMMRIIVKRVYDSIDKTEGVRVLVDRIWPRGITKQELQADHWVRDAAPSDLLRKWFGHDPARWEEFKIRYRTELEAKPEITRQLLDLARDKGLVLLFSARDTQCNQAVALKEYLLSLVY